MTNLRTKRQTAFAMCVASAVLSGCNTAHTHNSARATAPGLHEDAALYSHGGANPNGPYTVVDHAARLVKRPTAIDVNAASPCEAADLSLFESGAQVEGERRSVRLNLVNHATEPCRLSGYPAISLLRQDGSLLGSIAIEKITAVTIDAALHPKAPASSVPSSAIVPSGDVLLVPSGEATFEIGWTSGPNCDQVSAIAVAAPGTIRSFTVKHTLTVCEGRILVTAVNDGTQL